MRYLILLILLSLAALAQADTLTLNDGRTLTGVIVEETPQHLTITADPDNPVSLRRAVPRSDISSITRDAIPAGVTYFEIPLIGTVGEEITARALADALAVAREQKPTYVILLIDSPGGLVSELADIIHLLRQHADLHTVAFVKRAHSAAALIAATCDTLVMYPGAQIGAATPFQIVDGAPQAVGHKVLAQVRALAHTAAEIGGHNPLLFEAMVDPDLALYASATDPPQLTTTHADDAQCISPAGKILMLTDTEAARLKLATPCRNYGDLRRTLNVEEWSARSTRGRAIMNRHAQQHRDALADHEREQKFRREAQSYRESALPELQQLRQRITDAEAAIAAATKALDVARQQRDISLRRIALGIMPDAEEQKDTRSGGYYLNRSEEADRLAMELVEQNYQARAAELTQSINKLTRQLQLDHQRAKELLDAAPSR